MQDDIRHQGSNLSFLSTPTGSFLHTWSDLSFYKKFPDRPELFQSLLFESLWII